jgi:hypothetical protein
MIYVFHALILFASIVMVKNIKKRMRNRSEKGKVLMKLKEDNLTMNMIGSLAFIMIVFSTSTFMETAGTGEQLSILEITQFVSTAMLSLAIGLTIFGRTSVTETGIIKNNNLVRWKDIESTEWTGFKKKTCKLILNYKVNDSKRTIILTVFNNEDEKEKLSSIMKKYRKFSKKKK